MAKNNNLTDYLTDLANAIREKKGTTDLINPQDFSAEIASIETGGGGGGGGAVAASAGAINFRDYDGTILHSYSKDAFLALTEMPSLPSQQGLICQGWNYTLADAQSYVTNYGKLEVGAMYITDDGKTRLYIRIAEKGRMDVPLYFSQSKANGVTIDWGDGSATETLNGSGNVNTTHHYYEIGDYVISLDVADGCTLGLGRDSTSGGVMGSYSGKGLAYCNMLQRAEIGKGVTSIANYAFAYCYSFSSVVIPQEVTSIKGNAFYYCYSLSSLVIPQGVTSITRYAFYDCYSLASVVIPNSVTSIGENAFDNCHSLSSVVVPQGVTSIENKTFYYCYSLTSVVLPHGLTSIGNDAFYNCKSLHSLIIPQEAISIGSSAFRACASLSSVVLPQGLTSIGNLAFYECFSLASVVLPQGLTSIGYGAFYNCNSLASIVIPQGVTSIGSDTFYNCSGMAFIDFRASTSVPSLSSTGAFSSIPSDCKIVVPDELYDSWISATNWSTYASQIVKASEFNG